MENKTGSHFWNLDFGCQHKNPGIQFWSSSSNCWRFEMVSFLDKQSNSWQVTTEIDLTQGFGSFRNLKISIMRLRRIPDRDPALGEAEITHLIVSKLVCDPSSVPKPESNLKFSGSKNNFTIENRKTIEP